MDDSPFIVIAIDHPSLFGALNRFLDELRAERRLFGPAVSSRRKPYPSMIDQLASCETMRLGLAHDGRIVAAASVDNDGEFALAVVSDWRCEAVESELTRAIAARAEAAGYPPLHGHVAPRVRLAG